ncbi:hypothetical protein OPKNFCMD_6698 [Methylobacterium crusticola]|uniref:Uncharacterized protein n=1 Tax=Methylobacterium crusticola TaxID=1697972 RepID=A0ABQ4R9Y5_9HYPH|nr:hypothetical protein OPKNFCMD_6698 [Methylobacterium crusticola]
MLRHAACVGGFRALLTKLPHPLPSGAEVLADLRVTQNALLDACEADEMSEAIEAERDARWLDACRFWRPEGVTCERLHRELSLYRAAD